jgi:hypothetical protein
VGESSKPHISLLQVNVFPPVLDTLTDTGVSGSLVAYIVHYDFFYFSGASAQGEPRPPHYLGFQIIYNQTHARSRTYPVGLL